MTLYKSNLVFIIAVHKIKNRVTVKPQTYI